MQDEALATVMNILGCSTSHARTLLIHFRWNTDALFGMHACSECLSLWHIQPVRCSSSGTEA